MPCYRVSIATDRGIFSPIVSAPDRDLAAAKADELARGVYPQALYRLRMRTLELHGRNHHFVTPQQRVSVAIT